METLNAREFGNAQIGEGTIIEPNVEIGLRYHEDCGPAVLGKDCMIRRGTVIYGDTRIGDHFQAGYNSVVRALVKIGDYCTLMNQSTIEGIVRFGIGVRVMSHVYIPSRTWVGDHVFIGPGVTFTNDRFPGRIEPMPTPRGATIEDHVMIGGGVTVMPDITIGEGSFIAGGAVVTKDIPPRSFVIGVPGRISPLPAELDRPNIRELTIQTRSFWDPRSPYQGESVWPDWWPDKFTD